MSVLVWLGIISKNSLSIRASNTLRPYKRQTERILTLHSIVQDLAGLSCRVSARSNCLRWSDASASLLEVGGEASQQDGCG